LLASDAVAQVAGRRDEDDAPPPLLVAPSNAAPRVLLAGHSSHSSHASHSSHSSHYSGGGGSWSSSPSSHSGDSGYVPEPPPHREPPPPPPKPARVAFIAYPGGAIFLDGKRLGQDVTDTLTLPAGSYQVRIVNRFVGETTTTIELSDGQTGVIPIHW
jgi:hypothetical protein